MLSIAERSKRLRQKRIAAKLCVLCGHNPVIDVLRCEECRKKHNDSTKSRKSKYKSMGLCACGLLATDGFSTCARCRATALINYENVVVSSSQAKQCKRCKQPSIDTYCPECAQILSQQRKRSRAKVRDLVFSRYGGYKCTCCGETEKLFLSIDHVANDGAAHRRSMRYRRQATGDRLYYWLRDNGFPLGFQVLCMNCNLGKQRNGGICPHVNSGCVAGERK